MFDQMREAGDDNFYGTTLNGVARLRCVQPGQDTMKIWSNR